MFQIRCDMGTDHDRPPRCFHVLPENVQDFISGGDIQTRSRFIQQQKPGMVADRRNEFHPGFHARGKGIQLFPAGMPNRFTNSSKNPGSNAS